MFIGERRRPFRPPPFRKASLDGTPGVGLRRDPRPVTPVEVQRRLNPLGATWVWCFSVPRLSGNGNGGGGSLLEFVFFPEMRL